MAGDQTDIYEFPIPDLNDPPDLPLHVGNLADAVETELVRIEEDVANWVRPCAKMVNTSSQTGIASGTSVELEFNTVRYDTDSMADLVNNRIVIQTPGIYMISGGVRWNVGPGNRMAVLLRVNGTTMTGNATTTPTSGNAYEAHAPAKLEQGDVIEVQAFHVSGSDASTQTGWDVPYLAVSWISASE